MTVERPFNFENREDRETIADLIETVGLDYYFHDYEPLSSFDNHAELWDLVNEYLRARTALVEGLLRNGVEVG